ncbi:hypothetical protein D3C71_2051290 [compost metagenome]
MLTRPSISPYSSTTSAVWLRVRLNCSSSCIGLIASGTYSGGRTSSVSVTDLSSSRRCSRSLAWIMPSTFSKPPLHTG